MNAHLSQSISRRSALRAGALGMLGISMGKLARLEAAANEARGDRSAPEPRAKSVIYIFLSGGLSQLDSFDMKPGAPLEIRGEFSPIPTRTPGLHICEHLPELARRSRLWALCRSLTHGSNEHSEGHHIMLTGRGDMPAGFSPSQPQAGDWPAMSAIAQHALRPRNNLPPAIVLPEKLVHRTGRVIPGQFAGQLGKRQEPFFVESSRYNPVSYGAYPEFLFHHRSGLEDGAGHRFDVPEMGLPEGLSVGRIQDRLGLVRSMNRQRSYLDKALETQPLDRYGRMAMSLLLNPATQRAFDVHAAAPETQDRYGRNSFGWSLLMARQLVEAGVRLVQVNLGNNETWDTHEAAFPNLKNFLFPPLDRALSALLDDLHDRGLLHDTLVVMASEFGRTPKIFTIPGARLPGRDHWGALQSVFFAGGGTGGGAVVGSSDNLGGNPTSDPQSPEDLAATIFDALGIPPELTWTDLTGRPHRVYHGNPIQGLSG